MKHPRYFLLAFLLFVFAAPSAAQPGWQWGVGATALSSSGMDVISEAIDDSGNVVLTGNTGSVGYVVFGGDTVLGEGLPFKQFVVKCDSNGHFLWARSSRYAASWPLSAVTDRAGAVYVFGFCWDSSFVSFDTFTIANPIGLQYYLVKYSPGGNVMWAKSVANSTRFNYLGAMGIDGAGNLYVAAHFDKPLESVGGIVLHNASTLGDTFDVFIAKYDSSGNAVWAKSFGGHSHDFSNTISVTPAGNIYLSGVFYSPTMTVGTTIIIDTLTFVPFLAKLDSAGNVLWAKQQDHHITVNSMTTDAAENLYMVGHIDSNVILGTDTLLESGIADAFVARYDSSGIVVWAKSAGSTSNDYGNSITVDNCGHLWVSCGTTGGAGYTMNFSGHIISTPTICSDAAFIAEYSLSGLFDTAFVLPSGGDDWMPMVADNNGSLYFAGDYRSVSMIFGSDTLVPYGTYEQFFLAKYTAGCGQGDVLQTGLRKQVLFSVSIFPNPAAEECTIHCDGELTFNSFAFIYDLSGRLMSKFILSGSNTTFSVAGFAPGIYQCQIISGDGKVINQKMAVVR